MCLERTSLDFPSQAADRGKQRRASSFAVDISNSVIELTLTGLMTGDDGVTTCPCECFHLRASSSLIIHPLAPSTLDLFPGLAGHELNSRPYCESRDHR